MISKVSPPKPSPCFFKALLTVGVLSSLVMSCGQDDAKTSQTKITNGVATSHQEHPGVVLLLIDQQSICTATHISADLILTAAHCVDGNPAEVRVFQRDQNQFVMRTQAKTREGRADVHLKSGWEEAGCSARYTRNCVKDDLAVVRVNAVPGDVGREVSANGIDVGEEFTIVGWGNNVLIPAVDQVQNVQIHQQGSAEVLRAGRNVVAEKADGAIFFTGLLYGNVDLDESLRMPIGWQRYDEVVDDVELYGREDGLEAGEESVSGSGDSGGPMFNDDGELVGVTSGGFYVQEDIEGSDRSRIRKYSQYVDLASDGAKEFLRAWLP